MRRQPIPRDSVRQTETLYLDSRHGLSGRGRALVWIVASFLLIGCAVGLVAANALPFTGSQTVNRVTSELDSDKDAGQPGIRGTGEFIDAVNVEATAIKAMWDGPAINLDWSGGEYARAEGSFIGDRTVSPGDHVVRSLNIVNDGPSQGVLTVEIDFAEIVPAGALNPGLAEDVTLFWNVKGVTGQEQFSVLVPKGTVNVAEISLLRGEQVAVSIGFEMAKNVETSRALGAASTVLNFDVDVKLTGDTSTPVLPKLPITGSAGLLALLGIAVLTGLFGWLLLAIRRQRRWCDDCEEAIKRKDHWVKHSDSHGARKIQCERCYLTQTAPTTET
ncbi:hypothetical protein SAMN04489740_4264 [Arthrobacter alpinus]|uniref:C2H2-type domain-containing protein n=1 Tax=Arthrobacter alpinus TaxID=656366 RepID=A0A1H5PHD9_9MICC|nr:hypothetical protein [Arthrobacter alpinus]SEF12608.1 hypothetical protein SAMN04489740_4264 [Arthrobacter alpinus]